MNHPKGRAELIRHKIDPGSIQRIEISRTGIMNLICGQGRADFEKRKEFLFFLHLLQLNLFSEAGFNLAIDQNQIFIADNIDYSPNDRRITDQRYNTANCNGV